MVVVAYTEINEIGEDRVENLVLVTQVIPALFDRREIRAYLATADGTYLPTVNPLPLPPSVLHLEAGPPGVGLIALTDEGISRLRLDADEAPATLRLEPVIVDPPLLAGTGTFFAALTLVHDLDGDGLGDVLLPSSEGLAVYLTNGTDLATEPAWRIEVGNSDADDDRTHEEFPWPTVDDVNGDGLPDLVFPRGLLKDASTTPHLLLGSGGGRFRPLRDKTLDCHDEQTDLRVTVAEAADYPWPHGLIALRDLDGDGRAEAVLSVGRPRDGGFRKGLKDAKRPIQRLAFHRLTEDLRIEASPYFETEIVGHTVDHTEVPDSGLPFRMEQFLDLDGDGRDDLITITLDFSMFQVLKIMATKKIGVRLDFHVYAQLADGTFREVPDLDLSEKLKFDLNDLKIGRFGHFAGDFDGDGRQDFAHLGRGKVITLHAGQPGCRYPKRPDLSIELDEEPDSLDLIVIEDLDGDGRSDLRVTRPLPGTDPDATAPVRLDLYLSGGTP